MRKFLLLSTAFLIMTSVFGIAQAQSWNTINYGENITGELHQGAPETWWFEGSSGDVVHIVVDCEPADWSCDPVLELLDQNGAVLFEDDNADLSFWQSLKNAAAKIIYGVDPPESSLCFVWSNIEYREKYFNSPYSKTVKIIPIERGDIRIGHWITCHVDITYYYQEIFKRKCPSTATLAIMSDTDNTRSHISASIDYIELRKK